jgi:hypothetical protein
MSDPQTLNAHNTKYLCSMSVQIPDTWTPEQALAVFELLDELREKVFEFYRFPIQDLLQDQQGSFQFNDSDTPKTDRQF